MKSLNEMKPVSSWTFTSSDETGTHSPEVLFICHLFFGTGNPHLGRWSGITSVAPRLPCAYFVHGQMAQIAKIRSYWSCSGRSSLKHQTKGASALKAIWSLINDHRIQIWTSSNQTPMIQYHQDMAQIDWDNFRQWLKKSSISVHLEIGGSPVGWNKVRFRRLKLLMPGA